MQYHLAKNDLDGDGQTLPKPHCIKSWSFHMKKLIRKASTTWWSYKKSVDLVHKYKIIVDIFCLFFQDFKQLRSSFYPAVAYGIISAFDVSNLPPAVEDSEEKQQTIVFFFLQKNFHFSSNMLSENEKEIHLTLKPQILLVQLSLKYLDKTLFFPLICRLSLGQAWQTLTPSSYFHICNILWTLCGPGIDRPHVWQNSMNEKAA